jgi:hypothetical protein
VRGVRMDRDEDGEGDKGWTNLTAYSRPPGPRRPDTEKGRPFQKPTVPANSVNVCFNFPEEKKHMLQLEHSDDYFIFN